MTNSDRSQRHEQGPSWLQDSDRRRIAAVFESESACFSDLVRNAGLNPKVDLRFANLAGVDFLEVQTYVVTIFLAQICHIPVGPRQLGIELPMLKAPS